MACSANPFALDAVLPVAVGLLQAARLPAPRAGCFAVGQHLDVSLLHQLAERGPLGGLMRDRTGPPRAQMEHLATAELNLDRSTGIIANDIHDTGLEQIRPDIPSEYGRDRLSVAGRAPAAATPPVAPTVPHPIEHDDFAPRYRGVLPCSRGPAEVFIAERR